MWGDSVCSFCISLRTLVPKLGMAGPHVVPQSQKPLLDLRKQTKQKRHGDLLLAPMYYTGQTVLSDQYNRLSPLSGLSRKMKCHHFTHFLQNRNPLLSSQANFQINAVIDYNNPKRLSPPLTQLADFAGRIYLSSCRLSEYAAWVG